MVPHPTPPIPGVNVKVPFQGTKYGKHTLTFLFVFVICMKKIEKCVLKSLRRVAFVGWDVAGTCRSYIGQCSGQVRKRGGKCNIF